MTFSDYRRYSIRCILNCLTLYKYLHILLKHLGISMNIHYNRNFTTKNQENDASDGNRAVHVKGAWWFKYAVLFLFALRAVADAPCCKEKERTATYLDVAIDLISKAKNSMPECSQEKKECPKIKATDCADWYERGYNKSGLYSISPVNRLMPNTSVTVFCDMSTDGGGWTVIQRRGNFGRPKDYFYKDWESYRNGFGDADKDFWLGNNNIFALTNQKLNTIRFDLQDRELMKGYAMYTDFWIDAESNKYMIHISGYSGNAGNSMLYHNLKKFSTKDQKNNDPGESCAIQKAGAWWFDNCYRVHLNGMYNLTDTGVSWYGWKNSKTYGQMIWTEMKIRPKKFNSFSSI